MGGSGPFGESSGGPAPIAVENFRMLRDRQTADTLTGPAGTAGRVNLLNWDGKGHPAGLFPPATPPPPDPPSPGAGHHAGTDRGGDGSAGRGQDTTTGPRP
jgi:nitrate reductase beta subunit